VLLFVAGKQRAEYRRAATGDDRDKLSRGGAFLVAGLVLLVVFLLLLIPWFATWPVALWLGLICLGLAAWLAGRPNVVGLLVLFTVLAFAMSIWTWNSLTGPALGHDSDSAITATLTEEEKRLMSQSCTDSGQEGQDDQSKIRACANNAEKIVENAYGAYVNTRDDCKAKIDRGRNSPGNETFIAEANVCQQLLWGNRETNTLGLKEGWRDTVAIECPKVEAWNRAAGRDTKCDQNRLNFAKSSPYEK
jgi:hypothetical protein